MRVLLINLLLLELGCGALLWWISEDEPAYFRVPWSYYQTRVEALDDAELQRFRADAYDPRLGWDNRPGGQRTETNSAGQPYTVSFDARGARTSPWSGLPVVLAAYGDSHILADEVDDEQSWAVYLSSRLHLGVENFGVAGYGPDQALLKLEAHLAAGQRPPAVLLGIHEENIGRLLNNYRPFYLLRTGSVLGFKPRFRLTDAGLDLIPNPLLQVDSVGDVLEALDRAATVDIWWQENSRKVRLLPPFSLRAMDLLFTMLAEDRLLAHPFKEPPKRFFASCRLPSLWYDPGAVALVEALVARFVALGEQYDFHPILLMLPCMEHVPVPSYLAAVAALRRRFDRTILSVVDMHPLLVALEDFDLSRYRVRSGGGHLSAYGNALVAEALAGQVVWPRRSYR